MIVDGDIRPLWAMDLKGNACAMVLAPAWSFPYVYDRLGYDAKYGYFNNGTTLFDLDYLRKVHYSERALEYINTTKCELSMMDQDVTNVILQSKILRMPLQYNFQSKFLWKSYWAIYSEDFRKEILDAAQHPIIIHYSDKRKPWQIENSNWPYTQLWNQYYKLSPWKCIKRIGSLKDMAKRILKPSKMKEKFTEEGYFLFKH